MILAARRHYHDHILSNTFQALPRVRSLFLSPFPTSNSSSSTTATTTTAATTTTTNTTMDNTIMKSRTGTRAHYHATPQLLTASSSPKVEKVFQKILQLDLFEVHMLTELVNEKMGMKPLTDAQRAAMAAGGIGRGAGGGSKGSGAEAAEAAAEEEKKTVFDLKLTGFDAKAKIKVIKEIRAITGLGLKEAKDLVEGVPKTVKKDIKMEEAENIKAILEAVGATVEIA